jgi:hypothetical protein
MAAVSAFGIIVLIWTEPRGGGPRLRFILSRGVDFAIAVVVNEKLLRFKRAEAAPAGAINTDKGLTRAMDGSHDAGWRQHCHDDSRSSIQFSRTSPV